MPYSISPANEDIISGILNWVCPECGGRMGGRTKEFKCQGECLTDWRDIWERRVGKPGNKANSPQALGKQYKDYRTTEVVGEAQL
jgi:hypothetical protein